jgi:hypothetical protein
MLRKGGSRIKHLRSTFLFQLHIWLWLVVVAAVGVMAAVAALAGY